MKGISLKIAHAMRNLQGSRGYGCREGRVLEFGRPCATNSEEAACQGQRLDGLPEFGTLRAF